MSVPNQTPLVRYAGDGSTREFYIPFRYLDKDDIVVKSSINGTLTAGDYEIDRNLITFSVPPVPGEVIAILRETAVERISDYDDTGAVSAASLNANFDLPLLIIQEMAQKVASCVRVPETEVLDPAELIDRIFNTANSSITEAQNAAAAAKKSSELAEEAARNAEQGITDHNEDPEAHPDIREMIRKIPAADEDGGITIGDTKIYSPATGVMELLANSKINLAAPEFLVNGKALSSGRSPGEVFGCFGAIPPPGAFLLNGQTIPNCAGTYRKFWEWVTTSGVRVIDNDTYEAEMASAGVCGGFVISSSAGSVRLPTWKGYQTPLGNSVPVVGNGMTIGVSDGTTLGGLYIAGDGSVGMRTGSYGTDIGITTSGNVSSTKNIGITTDPTKSGVIADTSKYPKDPLYWCIQVFNAATALSEQESAQLPSQLQMKAQTDFANVNSNIDFVVDSWSDDNGNWYRKYRSGWCEQGGLSASNATSVTFFVPYSSTNYSVLISFDDFTGSQDARIAYTAAVSRGVNGFSYGEEVSAARYWEAKGYTA
jgi:hypothetical protein